MRRNLDAVRPAFIWGETLGLAYNYTLLSLCHRAVELHGRLRAGPNASCAALAAALPLAKPRRRVPAWYPPAVRQASQALMRKRRCASELAEPTDADGAAAKVCAAEMRHKSTAAAAASTNGLRENVTDCSARRTVQSRRNCLTQQGAGAPL